MALERPSERPVTFYPYALAIWHVVKSDRVQRDLALTALENLPTTLNLKEGIERLKWAQKQTDKLADYRNLIVHAPMQFSYPFSEVLGGDTLPTPIPKIGSVSTKPINVRRLRLIKSARFWKALRNDFMNLGDYVDFVTRRIAWRDHEQRRGPIPGALRSWPHRPRLPCIRRIDLIRKTIDRQAAIVPSPGRRRRPSRGQRQGQS
jgi:hypothetical protein